MESEPLKPFKGWHLLAGLFVMQMLTVGMTALSFGVLVKPVSEEFGLSRSQVNMGLIAFLLGISMFAPLVGRLLDRVSSRKMLVVGAALFATGFLVVAQSRSPTALLLAIVLLIGPGTAICGPLMASTLLARWFRRKRGRAFGISAVSTSLGGFLIAPLVGVGIEQLGWRMTLTGMGAGTGVIIVLIALWTIYDNPQSLGLNPDGDARSSAAEPVAAVADAPSRQTFLRNRDFWLIAIAVSLLQGVDIAITASLVPLATDRGVSLASATLLVSAVSISGIAGKLLCGLLVERGNSRAIFTGVAVLTIVLILVLMLPLGFGVTVLLCLVVGGATGATLPMGGLLMAERFEGGSYGTAMGLLGFIQIPFILSAVYFTGKSFDSTGDYGFSFLIFMGLCVLSALLIMPVRPVNKDIELKRCAPV